MIGGGPGGYPAAFAAARAPGHQVTLIDENAALGGVCLRCGCIPSKTLLHAADIMAAADGAKQFGIDFGKPQISVEGLLGWKKKVIDPDVGRNRHAGPPAKGQRPVAVGPDSRVPVDWRWRGRTHSTIEFDRAVIATGSSPVKLSMFPDDPRVLDSTTALEISGPPRNLLVVGGGYIGLELGSVYAALGTRVSVVEMTAGLLPGADRDLVRPLQKRLQNEFENIWLRTPGHVRRGISRRHPLRVPG